MRTYQETLDYLYSRLPMFQRIGPAAYKKDLTNITALCNALGNPQESFKSIHIAGTNGKGSVAHMLYVFMMETGYITGISTSPHYKDFRERIKVEGSYITEDYVVRFVENHKKLIEDIQPSFFELTTAMAFDYFRSEGVEWAIIETGLGGRLDSTNIINPKLSIITNISLDHQNMLGDTLELIAMEKAGIIKEGVPVIVGERQEEVAPVFIRQALSKKSEIVFASDDVKVEALSFSEEGMQIRVTRSGTMLYESFITDLLGSYQLRNIGTFIRACEKMERIVNIENLFELLPQVLSNVKLEGNLMGRMDIIGKEPLCILDSAHNEAGLKYLFEELKRFEKDKWHIVFGTVNDKDMSPIWPLLPKEAIYYFAKADVPRGMDARLLLESATKLGLNAEAFSSVSEAFETSKKTAGKDDLIVICGSIFVVAEILP
ncbi:MAG: bifunctional folylpolyglutamate synthase/dihydrofolate synthase [Saprospiraceae bacterium]|nr:bifunctional folylpolyglutamate synthase/dihydrofolate synthase [Saprospiraceae bacterium]